MRYANRNENNDEKEKFTPIDTIGAKIKKFRELRDLSQQELGEKSGFSSSSADARISQYETNQKVPREDLRRVLTNALGLNLYTLYELDLSIPEVVFHILFDLEETYGFHPVEIDNKYYLEFDISSQMSKYEPQINTFLKEWFTNYSSSLHKKHELFEETEENKKRYLIWKGEYPYPTTNFVKKNEDQSSKESIENDKRMEMMFKEFNPTDSLKSSATYQESFKESYRKTVYESDFLLCLKEIKENGVYIVEGSPKNYSGEEKNYSDLFSIKISSILDPEPHQSSFAELEGSIQKLWDFGIKIYRHLTVFHSEPYFTYSINNGFRESLFEDRASFWDSLERYILAKNTLKESYYIISEKESLLDELIEKHHVPLKRKTR